MNPDRVLGGAAIAALPAALAALFWLREPPPEAGRAPAAEAGESTPPPAVRDATFPPSTARASPGSAPTVAAPRQAPPEARAAAIGSPSRPSVGEATDSPLSPRAPSPVESPREPLSFAVELPEAGDDLGVVAIPDAPGDVTGRHGARASPTVADDRPGPCGGVLVRVITTSADPAWSFASIASGPGDPASLRRVGDAVGPWRVDSIEWDRVWLLGGGARCAATLHAGLREARAAAPRDPGGRPLLAAADDAPPVWQVPAEVARGIQRRSATELLLDPRAVASIYARGVELLAGTRLDPVREGDEVVGVELGSIAPDSLLDRLGVESGDVLRALDRERVASLDGVAAALADARSQRGLVARLARGGAEFDLELVEQALAME